MNSSLKNIKYSNVIIASCFSLQSIGIGVYISYGVFFNPLMSEFGWSRALISGASSVAFFISGLFGIYIGRLNDRIGPKIIMTITALFFGAGCILMAQLNTIWQLYLFFGIVFGIGLSSVDVIALSTIARWFPERRGVMTGITKVGTGAGQLGFTLLASFLIAGYGWRNAYIVLGITSLILLSAIAQLLRRDPGESKNKVNSKGPGVQNPDTPNPDIQNQDAQNRDVKNYSANSDFSFSTASKTSSFRLLCVVNFIVVSCLMSILVHIVPYGRDIGISAHKAASVLSTIGGVSMIGRFIIGLVIDRVGSKLSMIFSFIILITALSWLQSADALWKLYIFASIYGLAHGGIFTVISPIVAEFFGTKSHGALFGMIVFFGTTGGAIGPILTGYLFDIHGSYNLSFGLILLISAVSLVLLLFLKPEKQPGYLFS